MPQVLENIWTFSTRHLRVTVDVEYEHDPDFSWDPSGQTKEQVNSGEMQCFVVHASVLYVDDAGERELADDYLGNCIYENFIDFRKDHLKGAGSYFDDMVRTICKESRPEFERLTHERKVREHSVSETFDAQSDTKWTTLGVVNGKQVEQEIEYLA